MIIGKNIKKFQRNNCINYEIANRIIKNSEDNLNKDKSEYLKNNNFKEEEEKGESLINNSSSKKEKYKNIIKNMKGNNINLLNNFIVKEDVNNITNLINDDIKNNNINNILKLDDKINDIKNEKKSIHFKLQNSNNIDNFVKNFSNNNNNLISNKNNNKNTEKKNIFRFGLNNRKLNNNYNNISLISNNLKPHLKLKNLKESNLENDIKINDNLVIQNALPLVPKTSKNSTLQLNNSNKNIINKNIQNLANNSLKASKNSSISLKKSINYNYNMNPSSQIKYLNLLEKFQENNGKSSSLKIIKNMKNDSKLDNKKKKMSLRNRLRLSSKNVNNLNNKNFDLNKNKVTDMYSPHGLRSKSTINFVKLKSAHPRTPKNMNKLFNSNLNKVNNEDNKGDLLIKK